jgi:hypothetical protein
MSKVIDFAVTPYTVSVIYPIFTLPVDAVVLEAGYEILTAGTASSTLDFGFAGGTELLSAIAIDAVAGTKAAGSLANPLLCKDSKTLDVQINVGSAIIGKIYIWAIVQDVTKVATVGDV